MHKKALLQPLPRKSKNVGGEDLNQESWIIGNSNFPALLLLRHDADDVVVRFVDGVYDLIQL